MNHRSFRGARAWAPSCLVLAAALVLSGCVNYLQPFKLEPARPGIVSTANPSLRSLPRPQDPVVVAVYRFRDQTGQYRPTVAGSTFSTAVTQGATSILVKALEDSGWFVPIEREGLSNLLNERQIIQSIRAQYEGPEGQQLGPPPPLLYAGVLLEGGVIGYDSNIITGGLGARYLGMGGSGQFRQDQVTIYLRAVSTQTGRVLRSVHTTKTILSQRLEGGVFRFIDVRELLETEAGYSFNEPPVIAVTEAIEEAVRALVVEGVREGLWQLADRTQEAALFAAYDQEVARARRSDYFGRIVDPPRSGIVIGGRAGAALLDSDYANPDPSPSAEVFLRYDSGPLGFGVNGNGAVIAASGRQFEDWYLGADGFLRYSLLPGSPYTPFLEVGAGALLMPDAPQNRDQWFPYIRSAVGFDFRLTPTVSFALSAANTYPLKEGIDFVRSGGVHDNVWHFRAGLSYAFPSF